MSEITNTGLLQAVQANAEPQPTAGKSIAELVGPTPFPGTVHPTAGGGILVSKMDEVINWARSNSLWPLTFGTSCCAIEMMSAYSAKYDWSRFGFEVARASPPQADVIIISGTIVNKKAPLLKRLYDKGLLYKGYTIQPYSPGAGTGLSSHELNMPGAYKEVTDTTVVALFGVERNPSSAHLFDDETEDVRIAAWTTTPWTL
ncbi:MAG TPA: class I tRNA ligase family protein, partial [Phnomibacter sp.]|nr:class I tRNA ligase family protein [Phnomibacter sp.]